jgi:hypothetical protein
MGQKAKQRVYERNCTSSSKEPFAWNYPRKRRESRISMMGSNSWGSGYTEKRGIMG